MGGASCTGNEFRVYCTISLLHWVRVSYIKLHHFKMNLHNPVHQNIETPVNVQAVVLLVQQTHKQAFMHEEASQTLQTDCLVTIGSTGWPCGSSPPTQSTVLVDASNMRPQCPCGVGWGGVEWGGVGWGGVGWVVRRSGSVQDCN